MSKKAKRRAARQAFPKAKSAPPAASRGRYAGGARGRTSAGSRGRVQSSQARGRSAAQTLRPPTIKRAAITGAIMAFLYFAVIQWMWKSSGSSTKGTVIMSLALFFVYAGVVYGVERWKYQRRLRSMKGSSK